MARNIRGIFLQKKKKKYDKNGYTCIFICKVPEI